MQLIRSLHLPSGKTWDRVLAPDEDGRAILAQLSDLRRKLRHSDGSYPALVHALIHD